MKKFVLSLILASEKAALIARACRQEKDLFKLLIEEKTGEEKNQKFSQDFKTLADVLIQETVKHDIGQKYPGIKSQIYGEESNLFTNTLGETICVQVQSTQEATSHLLMRVLDGNRSAADLLARAVHSPVTSVATNTEEEMVLVPDMELNIDQLGIWIDPIDSTASYIKGVEETKQQGQIYTHGLQVVTVLLGVYSKATGEPIIGVVNQPFHTKSPQQQWTGQIYWGLCYQGTRASSLSLTPASPVSRGPVAILSFSEDGSVLNKLEKDYTCVKAQGAGHKLLMVAKGDADVYMTAKPSTYRWDSCGPDAILNSLGGRALHCTGDKIFQPITYGQDCVTGVNGANNTTGIIAYRNKQQLDRIKQIFS